MARCAKPPSSGLPDAKEYHDDAGDAVLHYGIDDEAAERAKASIAREQAAERARLVYVALTRAVYRCYVVGGVYLVGRNSTKEARRSVLNWLVAGRGHDFGDMARRAARGRRRAGRLAGAPADSGGSISLEPLPVIESREPLVSRHAFTHELAARTSRRCCVTAGGWRASVR